MTDLAAIAARHTGEHGCYGDTHPGIIDPGPAVFVPGGAPCEYARLAEALAEAAENNLALAALAETNRKQIHAAEAQVAALVEKLTHWHERYMVDECSPEKCGTAALLSDLAPAAAKHDAEVLARTLTVVETTLVDYGINEPTCGIHAWRCEHPDRYPDYCKCLADLMSALREKLLGAVPDKLEVEGGQE